MNKVVSDKTHWYKPSPDKVACVLLVVALSLILINRSSGWLALAGVTCLLLTVGGGASWLIVHLLLRRRLKRPFQFGIRTILILMASVAVTAGWFQWKMERAAKQREAVATIMDELNPYHLGYDFEVDADGADLSGVIQVLPGPEWLCNIVGVDFLSDVVFVGFMFTPNDTTKAESLKELKGLKGLEFWFETSDADLRHIQKLKSLENLSVSGKRVSDRGLAYLSGLTNLRSLNLSDTTVTDRGLAHLSGLTNLRSLDLSGTKVTRDGLQQIRHLQELRALTMPAFNLTVDDLQILRGFSHLEELYLEDSRMEDAEIEKLHELFPGVFCE